MLKQAEHVGTEIVNDIVTEVDLDVRPFRAERRFGHRVHRRRADHRHRRAGQMAGHSQRAAFQGFRRFGLRHLRRLLLPRQGRGGRRRRQLARSRRRSISRISPRSSRSIHRRSEFRAERILQERLFRKENVQVIWDTVVDEINWHPGQDADCRPRSPASRCATPTPARYRNCRSTACSWRSAMRRRSSCSSASSSRSRTAICGRRRIRRGPTCPAFLPRAT